MRILRFFLLSSFAVAVACSASTSAPTGAGGDDSGSTEDTIPTTGMELVKGLPISEIALFQGPKAPLMSAGAKASGKAKAIVGRPGIFRVYVTPASDWIPRDVVATLVLTSGGVKKSFSDKKAPAAASTDDKLDSTFNFDIPSDVIAADTTYEVSLKTDPGQTAGGGTESAQFSDSLDAKPTGDALLIMVVPIQYNADGSGRLPDTSEAQLERYRAGFMKLYPAHKVQVTVRDKPMPWSSAISRSGSGFDTLLNAVIKLRQTDGAPKGTYYYGAFAAGASFNSWCGGGCVAGLSPLASNPSDSWTAASVGIGWSGTETVGTATHEVGHGHGRNHAPCQPGGGTINGRDTAYPYTGAQLGVWALDIETKTMMSPTKNTDFMGYCSPTFISDYNYDALATRMAFIYGASYEIKGPAQNVKLFAVDGEGHLSSAGEVVTAEPTYGDARTVKLSLADGTTRSATGAFYPYDHVPGGLLVVPVGSSTIRAIEVKDVLPGVSSKLDLLH